MPFLSPELRAESRAVVRLAVPVVAIQIGWMLMGTVDSMMLGRVSEVALAAGALGNTVSLALVVIPMGILFALDPLIAQAFGAGDHPRIARHLRQGLVLALALSVPMVAVMSGVRPLLDLVRQQPRVAELATEYVRFVSPGYVAFLLFLVCRQTLQAMSILRPTMVAIVVANLFNVAANYALVFGHLGLPALGVKGSAIATSASRTLMLVTLVVLARRTLGRYWRLETRASGLRAYWNHLRLGVPIGIHLAMEMWLFSAVGLMMGSLGARELAGHQIAINLTAIAFMVPLGVAQAAATRVGNAVGAHDSPGARLAAGVCLAWGTGIMVFCGAVLAFLPGPLSRLFTPDADVVGMAMTLLPIAAFFELFDAVQVVCGGILRGVGDTRVPAVLALIGYWGMGLPLGWLITFRLHGGPQGLWWGLTVGLAAVGTLFLLRVRRRLAGEIQPLGE